MKVKVIVTVASVVFLGVLSVVVFTKTSVRVEAPAPHVAATSAPDKATMKGLRTILSGATPDPKLAP